MLYLLSDEAERELIQYSTSGGSLVVSYFTGISNDVDAVKLGGYGGALVRDHLGVFVDEFAPVGLTETVKLSNGLTGSEWTQFAKVTTATQLASYVGGVAAGSTALAQSASGRDWYVGTRLDDASNATLFADLLSQLGINRNGGRGTEVIRRGPLEILIDHNTNAVSWSSIEG
jgi:beta-galactosidase